MLAAFAVAISPVIWWNVETGWVHAMALHSRSGVTDSFHIRPGQAFRFLGEQLGVFSPLLMIGMLVAAALSMGKDADIRSRFLASQCAPLYALFLLFSLNSAGKPNWTAPAYFTGVILMVVFWRGVAARRPAWRWGLRAGVAVAAIMTVFLHNTEVLGLPPRLDPMRRAQGWPYFAARLDRIRKEKEADLLLGSDYSMASLMAFYLPGQPPTFMPPEPYGSSQFTLWPSYKAARDTRALFVTWGPQTPPDELRSQFGRIELVDDFWTLHHGRPMKRVCVYLCSPEPFSSAGSSGGNSSYAMASTNLPPARPPLPTGTDITP
jgi:membrane protease YdiL (CAAX protease family)